MTTEHAFHILGHDRPSNLIVTCDHASNHVPFEVNGGDLGLVPAEMQRHIAYDVGAAGVSTCSIPDDHISPRRFALFMARSVLRNIREGVQPC